MIIRHGTVLTPEGFRPGYSIRTEGERIGVLAPDREIVAAGSEPVVDAAGRLVAPGFVDMHVHGAAGFDTMDATPAALAGMASFFAQHGVTGFLATTMTASHAATLAAVRNVADYARAPGRGARVLGLHLEGPYVNPAARGAQAEEFCRPPDLAELDEYLAAGPVRMVTLAPELPGAEAFVRRAVARGVRVSVGHMQATYEQVEAAAGWGARQATHTFNAMTGLHHRQPGAVGAVLSDERLLAELIADGIHLHPAVIALAVRAKGTAGAALVTDAIRATGLPEGVYDLGGQDVIVNERGCWLLDPAGKPTRTLAGSTLTLDVALRNVMRFAGLSLAEALPLAGAVQARALGMEGQIGVLVPGALADIVLLDASGAVQATIAGGQVVYGG